MLEEWECKNYNVLNEPERNIQNSEGVYCDKPGAGNMFTNWRGSAWYRIIPPAGTRIPESPIAYTQCGTSGSGHIQGVRKFKQYIRCPYSLFFTLKPN